MKNCLLLTILCSLMVAACGSSKSPQISDSARELERKSIKHFGVKMESLTQLIVDGHVTYTHEQTIRLGEMGRRYRELERAGYVPFVVPGSDRSPRPGSGERIQIVLTERGRLIHDAFAP